PAHRAPWGSHGHRVRSRQCTRLETGKRETASAQVGPARPRLRFHAREGGSRRVRGLRVRRRSADRKGGVENHGWTRGANCRGSAAGSWWEYPPCLNATSTTWYGSIPNAAQACLISSDPARSAVAGSFTHLSRLLAANSRATPPSGSAGASFTPAAV